MGVSIRWLSSLLAQQARQATPRGILKVLPSLHIIVGFPANTDKDEKSGAYSIQAFQN